MDWAQQRVVVTGGAGFLGSHVVDALRRRGCRDLVVPRSRQCDLRRADAVAGLFAAARPRIVIHAAGVVGGIGANLASPGRFFHDNAIMGIQLLEAARQGGVEKFVTIGTVCAYPRDASVPFREERLWDGYPERTNSAYALAKKMLLVQGQAYREQYGFRSIHLLPANLYGPRDHFDLETGHVIPALIRKCVEALETGQRQIALWGDGSPTREFLYVEDAAEGIALAAERYDAAEPVNLGTGQEISIRELAASVALAVGWKGELVFDPSRPNGQPRRRLDTSRARALFGFQARHGLREGLEKTIAWYRRSRSSC